jgi:hypothetical protein
MSIKQEVLSSYSYCGDSSFLLSLASSDWNLHWNSASNFYWAEQEEGKRNCMEEYFRVSASLWTEQEVHFKIKCFEANNTFLYENLQKKKKLPIEQVKWNLNESQHFSIRGKETLYLS